MQTPYNQNSLRETLAFRLNTVRFSSVYLFVMQEAELKRYKTVTCFLYKYNHNSSTLGSEKRWLTCYIKPQSQ